MEDNHRDSRAGVDFCGASDASDERQLTCSLDGGCIMMTLLTLLADAKSYSREGWLDMVAEFLTVMSRVTL